MKNVTGYTFIDLKDCGSVILYLSSYSMNRIILAIHQNDYIPKDFDRDRCIVLTRGKMIFLVFSIFTNAYSIRDNYVNMELGGRDITNEINTENGEEEFWREISSDPNLSDDFIEKYAKKLNWYELCCHHPMTEEFIENNLLRVNWNAVCIYQKLSESFVERNSDKIIWFGLNRHQDFSNEFIEKHKLRFENVF